ncbi:MAG: S1 RNA-binding domain-containing protein [Clostridia bacterium]|nr:S1 RNA-binding domain-containing protein [Clostridia bacterium]
MRAIIPHDEVAVTPAGEAVRDIAAITRVGKNVCFTVREFCRVHGESVVVLSRKNAQKRCLNEYLDRLEIGDVLPARVTHFEPFGAFCDIGCGISSLLSIDCISVSRIAHPQDRFYLGQFIRAAVRARDEVILGERGRIALTHKELLGTWAQNADRFSIGQTVTGIVRSIESYGIFVELAPNLAGLAEYKPGFEAGQSAAVYIKNILPEKHKVKLVLIDAPLPERKQMKVEYFTEEQNVSGWNYLA